MTITAKERGEQVKAAFAAFLKEWDLEMSVEVSTGYGGDSVEGVEFTWNAQYDENHNTVVEFGWVNVGNWCNKDSV